MTFGKYVKNRRKELGFGLRDFCRQIDFDPGNWVRVEKGDSCAPRDLKLLRKIAGILDIDSDEYYHLAARTFLPPDLREKL
jgi:transcriptional regulator with XRE-family HTH domain